ncbi:hypothetical protein [Azohydromonas lata]|nr:hypothetical protein [Azohydromonas lata]
MTTILTRTLVAQECKAHFLDDQAQQQQPSDEELLAQVLAA